VVQIGNGIIKWCIVHEWWYVNMIANDFSDGLFRKGNATFYCVVWLQH